MSDVTLSYKGSDILELSDSGSATLKTGGTYCEADIEVEYVKPSGGQDRLKETTITLAQDYAQANTTPTTIMALAKAAIGTANYMCRLIGGVSNKSNADMAAVFYGGFDGVDIPLSLTSGDKSYTWQGVTRVYSEANPRATLQGNFALSYNCKAFSGSIYKVWGWD